MGPPAKRRREQRSLSVASELSPTSIVGKLITGELEATLTGSLLGRELAPLDFDAFVLTCLSS